MSPPEDFARWKRAASDRIERRLAAALPTGRRGVQSAMRYATQGPSKRLRPLLCLAAADDAGGERALAAACAVEFIHCYSLVHDDLPCMDDDAMRRGRPSCHVHFNEAVALLAGDGLQALAFTELSRAGLGDAGTLELAQAAGHAGMVGGQDIDLARSASTRTALRRLHALKTGALFVAAARLGGLAAGVSSSRLAAYTQAAAAFGLAFQIADDIADDQAAADASTDQAGGFMTFVTVLGPGQARQEFARVSQDLRTMLAQPELRGSRLAVLCETALGRLPGPPR